MFGCLSFSAAFHEYQNIQMISYLLIPCAGQCCGTGGLVYKYELQGQYNTFDFFFLQDKIVRDINNII